jgi:hypothetical protein
VDAENCYMTDVDSVEKCKIFCGNEPNCNSLVYNRYKQCWLKISNEKPVADNLEHETISCQKIRNVIVVLKM